MIPKIIHYCWFGRGTMPELALKCIASWKKYLPDYELKLWNEDSFDLNLNNYAKEAYEARKYAFVTDFVRLYALYHEGGIYMDTDVEVIKPIPYSFLELPAFSGYESAKNPTFPTGLMASEKGGIWAKEQLDYYDCRHFQLDKIITNVEIISTIMKNNGFVLDGKYRVYKDCMHAFPKDYFCPKSSTGVITLTSNTICIHHFAGSWVEYTLYEKMKLFFCRKILGVYLTDKLVKIKRKLLKG